MKILKLKIDTKNYWFKGLSAFTVIITFAILMLLGIAVIPMLPVKLLPSVVSRVISIDFNWPHASAANIENEVTSKIEGIVSSVQGVKKVSSNSSQGKGNLRIALDDNAN